MSDIICPICNTNLEILVGGANAVLGCPRCRYKATDGVWQELIRTRKALEIAVDALKEIKDGKIPVSLGIGMDINDALDKITALTKGGGNE